jgi:hypothetical protein
MMMVNITSGIMKVFFSLIQLWIEILLRNMNAPEARIIFMPENFLCSMAYTKKSSIFLCNIAEGISMAYVYAVWAFK